MLHLKVNETVSIEKGAYVFKGSIKLIKSNDRFSDSGEDLYDSKNILKQNIVVRA